MILPPPILLVAPTPEQWELAVQAHMLYKKKEAGGVTYWKLYHSKEKRDCGC